MMKRAIVPLVLLVLSALTSAAQIHVRYTFSDFTVDPQGVRRMQITPLLSYTATGTNIVTGDKIVRTVNSAGSATVSNIIAGSYRVEFFGWSTTTIFTNSFGTNVSGLVDAVDYLTISTNLPNTDFAYSQSAADNLFLHKTGDAATGGLTNNSAAGFVGNGNGLTNLYRRLVSEFGAVGTADDTSTFNSAFSQVGAVIEIPFRSAGYTVGNLHITNSVTIINQGSVWYAKAGTTGALLDMHNNSNIMLRGINLQGLSTSSNYISMVPSLNSLMTSGIYINRGTLSGFNVSMKQNSVVGCVATGFGSSAYYIYNILAGGSEAAPLTEFHDNAALGSYIGFDFNSLTNSVSPEYSAAYALNAESCLYGAHLDAGNIRIFGSSFSHNGINVVIYGGDNNTHSILALCQINHATSYSFFLQNVDQGIEIQTCAIHANAGPIVIDASKGVKFSGCQFSIPPSMLITNSRPGVVTTGVNSLLDSTYQGLWANNTITNYEGEKFFHKNNWSITVQGDNDGSEPQWPVFVWTLRGAFPGSSTFNDNTHGPAGTFDSVPSIQFGTNAGTAIFESPVDPFYTNTITRLDFVGDNGSVQQSGCTFTFYSFYFTNGNKIQPPDSPHTLTFTIKPNTNTAVYVTNTWPDRVNQRGFQLFTPTIPGAYGSDKFFLVHAETQGRN